MPTFDHEFPGGNIEVLSTDRATWTVTVRPELRGGSPHRGWFYFKMGNLAPGRTYTLKVVQTCWAGIYTYSYDRVHWHHFAKSHCDGAADYTFTQAFDRDTVYVAMMEPYLQEHLDRFIADVGSSPFVTVDDFWTSEGGRTGKRFTITDPAAPAPMRNVWLTARMHAFEAVSSWVAEGLVRWLLSDDPEAKQLRRLAVVRILPLTDVDSVQVGSSGKHRLPIDFARDACDKPHWNAMKALLGAIRDTGGPDLYVDLHGPCGSEHDVFFYTLETKVTTPAYERALAAFRGHIGDTLGNLLPYTGRCYRCPIVPDDKGQSYAGLPYYYLFRTYHGTGSLRLALCIETGWGGGARHTAAAFRTAGAAYGKAIGRLLAGPTAAR